MGSNNNNGWQRDYMAKTNKGIGSPESDDHMGRKGKLGRDATNGNLDFQNRVREKKGLPPLESNSPDKEESKSLEEGEDDLGISDGELIVARRAYTRPSTGFSLGRPCGEDEFVAIHRKLRRDRATYVELAGRMVTYRDEYGERKGPSAEKRKSKGRKVPCPLKSIMVRLMPHEGEIVGDRMSKKSLDRAIDRAVTEFERATGAEVVTIVVHRMSNHDLHIHLQYTMVQLEPEPPKAYAKRHNEWKNAGIEMAKAELVAEGLKVHPRRVGARREKLIKEGKLAPEPVRGTRYRKRAALRSIADDAILGYKFRNKINLVRAAEAGDDPELPARVAAKRDEKGRFRALLNRSDAQLTGDFLDLWFERVWRESVRGQLTRDARNEMKRAGYESARDYVVLDTTVVESTHVERTKVSLKNQSDELEKARQVLEQQQSSMTAERQRELDDLRKKQHEIDETRQRLEDRESKLAEREKNEQIRQKDIEGREQAALDVEAAARDEREALHQRLEDVRAKEAAIPGRARDAEARGARTAFETLFPDRKLTVDSASEIVEEIKTEIEAFRDRELATTKGELAHQLDELRERTEPVAVAEVAARLRFVPDQGASDGGLVREVPVEGKDSIMQQLVLNGQKFLLSIVGSDKVAVAGTGAVKLLRAADPKASLEKVIKKLVEWFPRKKHAIMAEIIDQHGSSLLKEMMEPVLIPDQIPKKTGTGQEAEKPI